MKQATQYVIEMPISSTAAPLLNTAAWCLHPYHVSPRQWHDALTQVCQLQCPGAMLHICLFLPQACLSSLCLLPTQRSGEGSHCHCPSKRCHVLAKGVVLGCSQSFPPGMAEGVLFPCRGSEPILPNSNFLPGSQISLFWGLVSPNLLFLLGEPHLPSLVHISFSNSVQQAREEILFLYLFSLPSLPPPPILFSILL